MPDIALMARAVDYIEDNLREAITVAGMAAAVSYSLYHFCRVFNQATHHTPYDYLMRRRLSEAARALVGTGDRILDVALDYQFNSPETFSRAFRRMFDLQPSQVRRQGSLEGLRLMPRLTPAHLEQIARGAYLRPVLEEVGGFQIAGIMALVRRDGAAAADVASDLWALLARELGRQGLADQVRGYYGLAWHPQGWEERGYPYMAGCEMEGQEEAASALVLKALPALPCARFIHKGPIRDLPLTLDYAYHTWLPKSGRALGLPLVVEGYGPKLPDLRARELETRVYVPIAEASP